jgi:excisionase family DNA binding protein
LGHPQEDVASPEPNTPSRVLGGVVVSGVQKKTASEKRLFSIKELVDQLGATEWFWRSQIWSGRLPFVQVGRKMFVDRLDIEAFIEQHKTRYLA